MTGFGQMERIFPVNLVAADDRLWELPVAANTISPEFSFGGQAYDLDSYMADHRVTGVLVVHNGEILLERYHHGRSEDALWASFSVAKSVTSTLIGAAIEDGYIDSLDSKLESYVPEMAGSDYGAVTIRELLTMSSGIAWNEDYADPESDIGRIYNTPSDDPAVNPILSYLANLEQQHSPGTLFNYNTGETDLVGFVLSRATGRSLAEYLQETLWQPLGMEHDAAWQLDTQGHERGGCCMAVSLRDYARLGLFMLGDGTHNGERILPEGWVEAATSNQLQTPFPNGDGYGYFWWTLADGSFQARGIFGQLIHMVPEDNLVIVTNSAWPTAVGADLSGARAALVAAIVDAAN